MKIVHILLGRADPNTMNGVNKVVHNLATTQHECGEDVEVWGLTKTPDFVEQDHSYPLRLFRSQGFRFSLSGPLREAITELPLEALAHMHSVYIPELFAVSRQFKRRGIPWVLTPHSGYAAQVLRENRFRKAVYRFVCESRLVREAKAVQAIGSSEVADIERLGPTGKIALIPNGQDLNTVKGVCRVAGVERPVFGYCGRLATQQKGLDLLIEAFSRYKMASGRGELWLIGDGEDRRKLEDLSACGQAAGSIKFLGPMFGQTKANRLAGVDVFVHTSRWEGVPTAVLEAAVLGKPLLVSEETNLGGYVRRFDSGVVVAKNTPDCIAQAMVRMAFEAQLSGKQMGQRAQTMVRQEFNWPLIVERLSREVYSACQRSAA